MEKNYLITASLISSIDWLMNCPSSWKTKAYNDLKATLGRETWTPTLEIKRGMNFENKVCDVANGIARTYASPEEKESIEWFVPQIQGGKFQAVAKKIEEIDGKLYCLYTKADVLIRDGLRHRIQDIKTTGNYSQNKYLKTFQHLLYSYVFEEPNFEYLVQVFNKDGTFGERHKEVWSLPLEQFEKPFSLKDQVYDKVREVREFLREYTELNTLYETVYSK
jgi:hypothetical protein